MNDFSVCTTWGLTPDKRIVLLDVMRARLEYPELKKMVLDLARRWRASKVLIEDTSAGTQLIQELRREGMHQIVAVKVEGTKEMRAMAQTPVMEQGRVWLPNDAPWPPVFLHDMTMFPNGRYADQADSVSQGLKYIGEPTPSDSYIGFLKAEVLDSYNIKTEDLTVCFDHPGREISFIFYNQRNVFRESDGYFWATEIEWNNGARGLAGVVRLE